MEKNKISVSIYTLGCKLNQLESEAVAESFQKSGFTVIPLVEDAPADLVIVNTCTVTSKAEQKARRVIRKVLRNNAACVLVCGCYAELEENAIAGIDSRIMTLSGGRKSALLDLPKCIDADADSHWLFQAVSHFLASVSETGKFRYNPENFSFHSRAFLKIQDGCNRRCAYCRVRLARGSSESLDAASAVSHLRLLEEKGYNEAVITGVNLNQYCSETDLAGILERFLRNTSRIRLRLSSLEPEGVTEKLGAVLAHERICPHFHLSIQSGADAVLEKMRRPYNREIIRQSVAVLRSIKDDPFLGCDIIAGFPTESGKDFDETLDLCEKTGFSWIHSFPYSPRPGTEAFFFKNRTPEREIIRRANALTALAKEGRRAYINRQIGKTAEVLIEAQENTPDGFLSGVSGNYLKILIKSAEKFAPGSMVKCKITGCAENAEQFDAAAELFGF
jgi:threonylcarbamoyladenosine tRNA methylthiotransferase MtaB